MSVHDFRLAISGALDAVADALRGRKPIPTIEHGIAELRERVEDLEDSLTAYAARAERDETTLRAWANVRR